MTATANVLYFKQLRALVYGLQSRGWDAHCTPTALHAKRELLGNCQRLMLSKASGDSWTLYQLSGPLECMEEALLAGHPTHWHCQPSTVHWAEVLRLLDDYMVEIVMDGCV